ncbi:MAG: PQQ-binding-like beta-propeller repeat protein, partial [Pirellulales bacterium]|nr:PQQ-binding-like beta-propeller repeat protein [Pirellulales bacterium]
MASLFQRFRQTRQDNGNSRRGPKDRQKSSPIARCRRKFHMEALENRQLLSVAPAMPSAWDLGPEEVVSACCVGDFSDPAANDVVGSSGQSDSEVSGPVINSAPVAQDDAYSIRSNQQIGASVLGNDGDLICLQLADGKIVWQLSLPEVFGEGLFFFGYGSSPLVHGDKLIVNVGSEDVCVAALDKRDGTTRWRTDHAWHGSYASPVVATLHGQEKLLVFTGGMVRPPTGGLLCMNPETGAIDSEFPWRSDNYTSVNAASPVACGESRVFLSEDYGLGGVMVEYDAAFQPQARWTSKELGCQFQTPIHHGGTLYGLGGNGGLMMACDARSGRMMWNEAFYETKIEWQGRPISVSLGHAHLVHVDGAFLCLGEDGVLMRLDLNPGGFEILAKARLFYAPE